ILLNRPIVVTPMGVRLCRPSETVLEILPRQKGSPFIKEDGEVITEAKDAHSPHVQRLSDLPQVVPEHFQVPHVTSLQRAGTEHPPRILLLYGSLRPRSFSRLVVEESARLLQ